MEEKYKETFEIDESVFVEGRGHRKKPEQRFASREKEFRREQARGKAAYCGKGSRSRRPQRRADRRNRGSRTAQALRNKRKKRSAKKENRQRQVSLQIRRLRSTLFREASDADSERKAQAQEKKAQKK